ncbi:MAG: sulfatase [Planctomycetes bacterium]|nr:sulfatase [Planctomycetota bacterium]
MRNKKVICALIFLALVVCAGCSAKFLGESKKLATQKEDRRLNFVLIVTDDQRTDTLWAMENLRKKLVARGIEFKEGFVTTPLCCPSRASILTGLYSHNTGILANKPPYGGAPSFKDSGKDKLTLAVWLQNKGYKTALIGKYMNEYYRISPYIPPGWNKWIAFTKPTVNPPSGKGYTDFSVNIDGKEIENPSDYSTDFLFEESLKFINDDNNRPFFLYLTPFAPHDPATPAEQDKHMFRDFHHRPPSYNEKDISDKNNPMVQNRESFTGKRQWDLDKFTRNQLRSLQAVDRGIRSIIDELIKKDLLKNTVIIFTSDNGYLWGEHRLDRKASPYEEAIRVPFIIYVPDIPGGRIDKENLVLNIDIAPTILELAGIEKPQDFEFDGKSLVPILKNTTARLRDEFWIEFIGQKTQFLVKQTFYGVRTSKFKLIEYLTGEKEFYDLREDPLELDNQYENPGYQEIIAELDKKLEILKEEVMQILIEEGSKPEETAEKEEGEKDEKEADDNE